MTKFEEILNVTPDVLKGMKEYKALDIHNNIVEYWVKNENGKWVDKTAEEQLRREIEEAQIELQDATNAVLGVRRSKQ